MTKPKLGRPTKATRGAKEANERTIVWSDLETAADLVVVSDDDDDDIEGRDLVKLSQVMPAGRSKRDLCPNCFQIPATNGVCGC